VKHSDAVAVREAMARVMEEYRKAPPPPPRQRRKTAGYSRGRGRRSIASPEVLSAYERWLAAREAEAL
jgi:hypothetical protein